jgi:hypothetical protein
MPIPIGTDVDEGIGFEGDVEVEPVTPCSPLKLVLATSLPAGFGCGRE